MQQGDSNSIPNGEVVGRSELGHRVGQDRTSNQQLKSKEHTATIRTSGSNKKKQQNHQAIANNNKQQP